MLKLKINRNHAVKLAPGMKIYVDIQVTDEHGNKDTVSLPSVVEELCDDGCFLMHPPMHKGIFYPIPRDEALIVNFTSGGDQTGKSDRFEVAARFVKTIERIPFVYVKMEPVGDIESAQRRSCYRLSISMPVLLRRSGDADNAQEAEAQTINLSDGGMLIATDELLEKDEAVNLDFNTGRTETVDGLIIRTDKAEYGKYKYKTAIKFTGVDNAQKKRLYRFIVETQVQKRRRQI